MPLWSLGWNYLLKPILQPVKDWVIDTLGDELHRSQRHWRRARHSAETAIRSNAKKAIKVLERPDVTREVPTSFCCGLLETSMLVFDFEPSGYLEKDFHSQLIPWIEPEVPSEWAERWEVAQKKADQQEAANRIKDNPILALREFTYSRNGAEETHGFALKFAPTTYKPKRAGILLFNEGLNAGEKKAVIARTHSGLDPFLSRCLNVQLAIITSDNRIMVVQRNPDIINASKFTCGIAETMDQSDLVERQRVSYPSVFSTAYRGLLQEAGIDLRAYPNQKSIVKLTSIMLDEDYYEVLFSGLVDFRKATNRTLREETTSLSLEKIFRSAEVKDKWENKAIHFLPNDLDSLIGYMHKGGFTNYAKVCLIQMCRSMGDYTKSDVIKAVNKFYAEPEPEVRGEA